MMGRMKKLFIYLVCLLSFVGFTTSQIFDNAALWEQAVSYAESLGMDTAVVERLNDKDIGTLYQIGKHKLKQHQSSDDERSGLEILHALADDATLHPHVPSQVTLGFHYYQKDKIKALQYFANAGEEGPHQAALYNAGRLYGELGEWVPALAYIRAAATLGRTNPEAVTESLTETCLAAYEIMVQQLSRMTLNIRQSADIFWYANLHDFPPDGSEEVTLWRNAAMALDSFNRTFSESDGQNQNQQYMVTAFTNLHKLWESSSTQLSALQAFILLQHANDMLGMLAGLDDLYIPAAGGYSEALALSSYCYQWAAASEEERSCFNEAAVAAVAYYRRMNDLDSAYRVLEMGRSHPSAATHWETLEQTPRVYHSGLTSKPWWTMEEFPTAVALATAYENKKVSILQELRNVQALQEGLHPGGHVEVGADGSTGEGDDFGFRRISTPYIGLRVDQESTRTTGAGGWSEFGPLFDGRGWKADMCAYTPTLCRVVQEDSSSLCTYHATAETVDNVLQMYGTDTLVTLLRLRPGTHILPHNGTTNRRLIMHFCLEGCEGIQFTVGGKMVESYGKGDGSVIVFDDSFEHSVYNGGKQDRFVLVAVFAHPESIVS